MGGREEGKGTLDHHRKKIEDSEGMCVSEGDYDSCWSRMCNPDRNGALRDVLRGLLVLIALAIVVTIIFLLCFFLLNDMEKKEEELVDSLIKDFSTGNRVDAEPEFSIKDTNQVTDKDVYNPFNLPGFGVTDPPDQEYESDKADFTQQDSPRVSQANIPDSIFTALNPGNSLPPNVFNPPQAPPDSEIARTDESSFVSAFVPESELGEDDFHTVTYFSEEESGVECVPLRLPLCSGSMPWTITAFPNFVNNKNVNELQESVQYFQDTIIGSHCSDRATEYSCAILEPTCGPDALPLPPCKAFCEDIVKSCSEFLATDNGHNIAFDCSRFPDSRNPNDCVDINKGTQNHTKEELPQPREEPFLTSPSTSDIGTSDQSVSKDTVNLPTKTDPSDSLPDFSEAESTGETPTSHTETETDNSEGSTITKEVPTDNDILEVPEEKVTKSEEPNLEIEPELEPELEPNLSTKTKEEMNDGGDVVEITDVTDPPVFICDHTKFLCDDGSDCLYEESVCDGIQHCLDNSDELNCTQPAPVSTKNSRPFIGMKPFRDTVEVETLPSALNEDSQKSSRRPSLSEILLGSSLVAAPSSPDTPSVAPKKFRFAQRNLKEGKGKAIDSPRKDTFQTFRPSLPTPKPEPVEEKTSSKPSTKPSSKLSLASLLSSTAIAKVKPKPRDEPDYYYDEPADHNEEPQEEPIQLSSQRSLSALLSSAMPSFSTLSNINQKKCQEFQCLDGSCISLDYVGDGIEDCPDGSDETHSNDISLLSPKR